jgi:hypothetical protein
LYDNIKQIIIKFFIDLKVVFWNARFMKTQPRLKKQNRAKEPSCYSSLTNHAEIRKEERFKILSEELREQLDAQLFVHLGKEKEGPKVYRLIYSRDDAGWIVVVQDRYNMGIITVLPVEYYTNKHRKLRPEERREAKRMVHWGRVEVFPSPVSPVPAASQDFILDLPIAA